MSLRCGNNFEQLLGCDVACPILAVSQSCLLCCTLTRLGVSALIQTMTGFLIYDWIEQSKKQEIIQEVLKLLEQKVLEPHSGVWQCIAFAFACVLGLVMTCCTTICL